MLEMNKKDFIELLEMQANAKMLSSDRRRRLDGRLEKNTINLLASYLPNTCKYLITSNGCVRADWFKLNNTRLKNLHIFNNNTIYIQDKNSYKYTTIVIIKATETTILRGLTSELLDLRLTLTEIKNLESLGVLKRYSKLCDALNF